MIHPASLSADQVFTMVREEIERLREEQERLDANHRDNAARIQALRWVLELPMQVSRERYAQMDFARQPPPM